MAFSSLVYRDNWYVLWPVAMGPAYYTPKGLKNEPTSAGDLARDQSRVWYFDHRNGVDQSQDLAFGRSGM